MARRHQRALKDPPSRSRQQFASTLPTADDSTGRIRAQALASRKPQPTRLHSRRGCMLLVIEVIDREWVEQLLPTYRTDAEEGLFQHLLNAHTDVTDVGLLPKTRACAHWCCRAR